MTNEQTATYAGWRNVVVAMYDAKAVTDMDFLLAAGDWDNAAHAAGVQRPTNTDTPGRRLIEAIRVYADDVVAARCKQGPEGCRKPPTRTDLKHANFARLFSKSPSSYEEPPR